MRTFEIAQQLECWNCGYDLRGTERSRRCPECGASRPVAIQVSPHRIVEASIALETAGFSLYSSRWHRHGRRAKAQGIVYVRDDHFDEACRVLRAAGIRIKGADRPIIAPPKPAPAKPDHDDEPWGLSDDHLVVLRVLMLIVVMFGAVVATKWPWVFWLAVGFAVCVAVAHIPHELRRFARFVTPPDDPGPPESTDD